MRQLTGAVRPQDQREPAVDDVRAGWEGRLALVDGDAAAPVEMPHRAAVLPVMDPGVPGHVTDDGLAARRVGHAQHQRTTELLDPRRPVRVRRNGPRLLLVTDGFAV